MYSALALPSSIRAAPATNRIWSTIGGISSDAVGPSGLPVLRASASISRDAPCSTANAASTSGPVESGAVA
nr:hypothetical protein [Pseudonocardia oceani]